MSHAPRRLRRTALVATTSLVAALLPLSAIPAQAATAQARLIDDGCPEGRVPDSGLNDIAGNPFEDQINCLVWYGVASGTSSGDYRPTGVVTRSQMAVFLINLIRTVDEDVLDPTPPTKFDDVVGTAFETQIHQLSQLGIVNGSKDSQDFDGDGDTEELIYRPGGLVSRAQMAGFINATHSFVTGVPISTADHFFNDDNNTFFEDDINAIASVGVGTGTSSTTFNVGGNVTRAQMAVFLAREIDYLVELGFMNPPVTGVADVVLDILEVNQGRSVTGRIITEDGVNVAQATVDICDGDAGVGVPMNEDDFSFAFTIPFSAEVGLCKLDFNILLGNDDRELESQTIEVLKTEKVLAGPELVSIVIQSVGAETVTIRYEFNAATTLNDAVEASKFRLYGFAGQQFSALSATRVGDFSVEATFPRDQYDDATTGGIAQFAVQDQNGFQVAEYGFGIKSVDLNAGETSTPDLIGVTSSSNTSVTYTFDAPVYNVAANEFGAVYTSDGKTVSVLGDAVTNGGEGSTSFTVSFTAPTKEDGSPAGGVILRGYVKADSFASVVEGAINNARQAEDVQGPSQATSPHLTSVILDPANNQVQFVFSEAVINNAAVGKTESPLDGDCFPPAMPCQTFPGRGFEIYDINGDSFRSETVVVGSNNTLIAKFGGGIVTGLIQGGSADQAVALAARNNTLQSGVDEVGRQNTFQQGRTASPDLLSVVRLTDGNGDLRVSYTYDQTLVISTGASSAPKGDFLLYAQDNTRLAITSLCKVEAGSVEVICTLEAGTAAFTFAQTARYASSAYAAVNVSGNKRFSPEAGFALR